MVMPRRATPSGTQFRDTAIGRAVAHTMPKPKPNKSRRPSSVVAPAIVATDAAIVEPLADATVPDTTPDTAPDTAPTFDVVVAIAALYATANAVPPSTVPPAFAAMVDAIRAIVPTVPANVTDRRYRAIVDAFTAAFDAAGFPTADKSTPHTTRFGGLGITDAQNVVYVACAVSGMFVPADIVCCVWRAIAPHARCDYIGRAIPRGYATTTLSAWMRGDHGVTPWFDGIVNAGVMRAWYVGGGVTTAPKPATA